MDIELYNGDAKAIISTHGGYVTNLANDDGDILFPKRTLRGADGSEKVRGGCHVCLPNFGPGGDTGLAQHGFGRTSEWVVASKSEAVVALTLKGEGEYVDMESLLRYELRQDALEMTLTLKNNGESLLKVSPAFHPYFFRGSQVLQLDGETYTNYAEFAGTKFTDGLVHTVNLAGRTLTLQSANLPHWALWTDDIADYFCVEPTQNGNAFADDMKSADTLTPGQEKSYTLTIRWHSIKN